MAEETQVATGQSQPVDTIQIVTSEGLREYTNSKNPEPESTEAEAAAPEAEATEVATEPPPETDNAVQEDGIWKPKKDKPLSKRQIEANERFSKVTAERNEAQRLAEVARQEAAALRAKYEPAPETINEEPDPTKYTDAKEYAEDVYKWKRGQELAQEAAAKARADSEAVISRFNKMRDEFKATVADWDARAEAKKDLKMHQDTISAILESEYPAHIMYDLMPDDVARINAMPLRKQIMEITRMEQKFVKAATSTETPAPRAAAPAVEVSKAPPPINPIKTAHADPVSKIDKDGNFTGSQEEYERARREGKIGAKYH